MCDKRFKEIDFKLVPGKCLKKNVKAFLNIKVASESPRFPSDPDRNICRANLIEFLDLVKQGKKKINAGSLFIHEIVEQLYNHLMQEAKATIDVIYGNKRQRQYY